MPIWFYLLSLGVILGGQVLYAWRWRQVLAASGVSVTVGTAVRQYFIGVFLNNFFPSTVGGDMAKVYYLGRHHGYRPIAASIVLDRCSASDSLRCSRRRCTGWHRIRPRGLRSHAHSSPSLRCACSAASFSPRAAPEVFPVASLRSARLRWASQNARSDSAMTWQGRPGSRGSCFNQPPSSRRYFFALTAIYRLFLSLDTSAHPAFLTLMTAVTTASLLSNVPISINGLGLREQLHVILLQPLGVTREAAVAISLLTFAHLLVSSLLGVLFWLQLPDAIKSHIPASESEIPLDT